MLRLSANRLSAGLSGVGFGLLMPWLHTWLPGLGLSAGANRLAFASSLLLLFFIPVLLLVVGVPHLSQGGPGADRARFRASRAQVGVRALFWLAGASAALLTGCAALDGAGSRGAGAYDPGARVTRATIFRKIDPARLQRARGPGTTVRAATLVPVVGAGMAELVADELARLLVSTELGRSVRAAKTGRVAAFVLRTEDDRDVTVLSDYAGFAAGGCVKLFESPRRRDYPRIAPASGCAGGR